MYSTTVAVIMNIVSNIPKTPAVLKLTAKNIEVIKADKNEYTICLVILFLTYFETKSSNIILLLSEFFSTSFLKTVNGALYQYLENILFV